MNCIIIVGVLCLEISRILDLHDIGHALPQAYSTQCHWGVTQPIATRDQLHCLTRVLLALLMLPAVTLFSARAED